ncbi:hypothetical protein SKAU_G00211280 [Synaphobranchus kaupii]|uniref:Uncharacterized protein n=1 Tax=Synaphobranchus kaupii TaxID=118154 RepID=A0A9Q1F8X5_SYNKA|nr:hypothetical protein SKAU_G00211280 [Synaphobranchus kaupii]
MERISLVQTGNRTLTRATWDVFLTERSSSDAYGGSLDLCWCHHLHRAYNHVFQLMYVLKHVNMTKTCSRL